MHIKVLANFRWPWIAYYWQIVSQPRRDDGEELQAKATLLANKPLHWEREWQWLGFRVSRGWWCYHLATSGLGEKYWITTLIFKAVLLQGLFFYLPCGDFSPKTKGWNLSGALWVHCENGSSALLNHNSWTGEGVSHNCGTPNYKWLFFFRKSNTPNPKP